MIRKVHAIIICLSLAGTQLYSQTFQQWAQTVGWDGVSNWKHYMIIVPGFMGPNALPIPSLSTGRIDTNTFIGATAGLHFSRGDNTQNATIYANYCLVKDRISFDLNWIPYEHYTMSQAIKEKRHVFSHFFYDREATGDVALNTNIQLLNRWRKYVRLALRIGYRFPTSSGLGAARFPDAPGYYFDLSFGKSLGDHSLTLQGMLGFYSWQMQTDEHQQDDAFLFGAGVEWNKNKWRIQLQCAGYLGYLRNSGDKPIVTRFIMEKKIRRIAITGKFQQGLHDFGYSTTEAGIKYFLNR